MIAAFHAGILIAILCPLALAIETLRRAVPKTRPGHSSQVRYRYRNPEGRDSVPESCVLGTGLLTVSGGRAHGALGTEAELAALALIPPQRLGSSAGQASSKRQDRGQGRQSPRPLDSAIAPAAGGSVDRVAKGHR
jgi:hypothetical protein